MEASHEAEASPDEWEWMDGTIILVGLLIMKHTLFKSGYPAEVITELDDRINKLVKKYTGTGKVVTVWDSSMDPR